MIDRRQTDCVLAPTCTGRCCCCWPYPKWQACLATLVCGWWHHSGIILLQPGAARHCFSIAAAVLTCHHGASRKVEKIEHWPLTFTRDLDFFIPSWSWHIHVLIIKVRGHLVQEIEWKQTDGWMDMTDCIIIPANAVSNKLHIFCAGENEREEQACATTVGNYQEEHCSCWWKH